MDYVNGMLQFREQERRAHPHSRWLPRAALNGGVVA
jgi:hypothetical protein